ncbi:Hypothetical predicted protein, partial [Paramuricea clavata]
VGVRSYSVNTQNLTLQSEIGAIEKTFSKSAYITKWLQQMGYCIDTSGLKNFDVTLQVFLEGNGIEKECLAIMTSMKKWHQYLFGKHDIMQEGKPVCFTSHTLTDTEKQYAQIEKECLAIMTNTEKQYAQIEKECLAIMTSMKKWHQYLFGKHDIIVQTDHQPLETIFKKPLSKAPRRLQRMMLQLQQYNFEVVYKRGKELYVADTLSRAALKENCAVELESEMVFRVELEQMGLKPAMMSDCTLNRMKEETRKDQTLKCLLETVRKGWPSDKLMVPPCIKQYWFFREEITLYEGVLLKTHQVIVPTVLRKEMLEKIHKSHQAESAVKVAKNILKKSGNEDPYLALLAYRNTPQQGYVYSPAERLMARKLKDIVPMVPSQLKPRLVDSKIVREDIMKRRIQSKIQYDKKASRPLKDLAVDDRVYVKPRQKYKPWIYGKVIERPDERTCVMQTPLGLVRRNRKHLRKIKGESSEHQVRDEQFMDIVSLPDIDSDVTSSNNNTVDPDEEGLEMQNRYPEKIPCH